MVVPPKHPKMIIFGRKTHGCWVPTVSGNPHLGPLGFRVFVRLSRSSQLYEAKAILGGSRGWGAGHRWVFPSKNRGVSPKMDGFLLWKTRKKKWMIWGYHHFWKHPGVFFWKFPVDLALLVHNFLGGDVSKWKEMKMIDWSFHMKVVYEMWLGPVVLLFKIDMFCFGTCTSCGPMGRVSE